MKWKADLPKMPRLPKVPIEPGDPTADELGPPPPPSAYRAKNPSESKPVEYRAPSILVEHRRLALLFLAAAIGVVLYCLRPSHHAAARDAAAPAPHGAPQTAAAGQTTAPSTAESPIYVQAVPDKDH